MTEKDLLVSWLNDAYAMEQALIPVLQNHAKDAENDMPAAADRLRRHIEETEIPLQRLSMHGTAARAVDVTSAIGSARAPRKAH